MVTKIKSDNPDIEQNTSENRLIKEDMDILYEKKRGRPSMKPEGKKLLQEYMDMTASQLSIQYHVSEGTIKRWIREIRNELKKEREK